MFIGSSAEGLKVARALQLELEHDVDATLWSQGVFGLSEGTLEALEAKVHDFEFAALVLTPDDLVTTRGETGNAPRDNVVFEAALFMGALGRRRVFLVACRDDPLDLPTDLAGITLAQYNRRPDDNLIAALGPVGTNMRKAIASALAASGVDATDALTLPLPAESADFTRLLTVIDQMSELFQTMNNGQLRGDHARVYNVLLGNVKQARPADSLVTTPSAARETALGGVFNTTVAEARTGLNIMRSALVSAQEEPQDFVDQVVEASLRLIRSRAERQVTGEEVAEALDRPRGDMGVYHAFMEAKKTGRLDVSFPGGMALPSMVRAG